MTDTAIKFEAAPIPASIAPVKVNPYVGLVKGLSENMATTTEEGKSQRATLPWKASAVTKGADGADLVVKTDEIKAVEEIIRLCQEAGKEFNVTIRKKIDVAADNKTAVLTLWAVPRITRKAAETAPNEGDTATAE